MEIKLFEVLDASTFIPVMAMVMEGGSRPERYLLGRCGWNVDGEPFVVMNQLDCRCEPRKNPDEWSKTSRTMRVAHEYIATNWSKLTTGDVVDVAYILGESDKPKVSERIEK